MSESDEIFETIGTQHKSKPPASKSTGWRLAAAGSVQARPQIAPVVPKTSAHIADDVKRRWAANDTVFWAAQQTYDNLPPGLYRCGWAEGIGPTLAKQIVKTDELMELPDSASNEVLEEIEAFWQLEAEFDKRGFLHKRGVLLWGPPGSGKSSTLSLLIRLIVSQYGGIGIFIDDPAPAAACIQMIRKVEPTRPVVALFEDLDALVERHGENEYLALLDGEAQIGNVVYVATTNYPERLDKRFVDRPSRFDIVKKIGMPSAAARRHYLLTKEPSLGETDEIDHWVHESDGLSIAHLREMIILVRCYQQSLEGAIERLNRMRLRTPRSSDLDSAFPVGFSTGR